MKKRFFVCLMLSLAFMFPLFGGTMAVYADSNSTTSGAEVKTVDKNGKELELSDLGLTGLTSDISDKTLDFNYLTVKNFKVTIGYNAGAENTKKSGIFNTIKNSTLKNLTLTNGVFVIDDLSEALSGNNFGLIAGEILGNSNVSNIQLVDCTIVIRNTKSVANLNIGGIAGVMSGCLVENVSIKNLQIVNVFDNTEINITISAEDNAGVVSNLNIGAIAGILQDNSIVKNSIIDISSTLQSNASLSTDINIGGIAGFVSHAQIYTTISSSNVVVEVFNNLANVNLGGVVGFNQGNIIKYINNIAMPTLQTNSDNNNIGALIGKLDKNMVPESGRLLYFQSNSNKNVFGNYDEVKDLYNIQLTSLKVGVDSSLFTKQSNYQVSNWEPTYFWDMDNIWDMSGNNTLPTLQAFGEFSVTFSETESLETLGLDKIPEYKPTEGNAEKQIVSVSLNGQNSNSAKLKYGQELKIQPTILTENGYNKFFYPTGLKRNGVTIFNVSDYLNFDAYSKVLYAKDFIIQANADNAGEKGYSKTQNENITIYKHEYKNANQEPVTETITEKCITENQKYTYTVDGKEYIYETIDNKETYSFGTKFLYVTDGKVFSSNFNEVVYNNAENSYTISNIDKSKEGTYSVILTKYKYKLYINALQSSDANVLTGKVMPTTEPNKDNAKVCLELNVEYGITYDLTAVAGEDYSDIVNWKMWVGTRHLDENGGNIEGATGSYKNFDANSFYLNSSSLVFTFDENSDLNFVKVLPDNPDNIVKTDVNELGASIDLEFTNNIRVVRFQFEQDGADVDIKMYRQIKLYVSGSIVKFDEENGYTKKLVKGSSYNINLSLPQKFSIVQWLVDGNTVAEENVDMYKLAIEDKDGEIVVTVQIAEIQEESDASLLWLWITLGGVGLAIIVVLIVVVSKKKKKNNAYKRMFY